MVGERLILALNVCYNHGEPFLVSQMIPTVAKKVLDPSIPYLYIHSTGIQRPLYTKEELQTAFVSAVDGEAAHAMALNSAMFQCQLCLESAQPA